MTDQQKRHNQYCIHVALAFENSFKNKVNGLQQLADREEIPLNDLWALIIEGRQLLT
jgi:hypothetical protein